jgi:osmotically-inducible protein OsmY
MGKNKDIRDAVEAELAFDPLVDATGITVKNLNGDVALNGTVPSYPQYLEAAAAAQRIAGVKNVYNHCASHRPARRASRRARWYSRPLSYVT